jgi:oxygen-independent coproporphyrinogen-3 oxidase
MLLLALSEVKIDDEKMIQKYNVSPRYTSYPTVPYWNETDFI